MDVLVIGGSGLLGRELIRQASTAGRRVVATYHRRRPAAPAAPGSEAQRPAAPETQRTPVPEVRWTALDIRRRADVAALVRRTRPDVILNAAFQQLDWATTADGAMHVAAASAGARLVHVSSDAVFSGAAVRYDESRLPDPITPYGAAKAAAETAVKGLAPGAVIARTSLIVGTGDSTHEALVHALAAGTGGSAGVLFTDDIRCPVHVCDLAAALLELAASGHSGIHHVAGADAVSRYELGVLIARRDGLDESLLPAGRRAERGPPGALDVRLDCARTRSRLTTRLRGAREFLAAS